MAHWTAEDIPDLTGRTALVTGANSGLGFETSVALARHGATVIMASRDEDRCGAAAERLVEMLPSANVEPHCLDLADLDRVRTFAADVSARHDKLDILVNNAGVMAPPKRATTMQGYELQFGTNHLGHFALTGLLLPALMAADGSRVVTVSSIAYQSGQLNFDDLQYERKYSPYGAYSDSKLANMLFMLRLDAALTAASANVLSVGAHPGFASTNLQAAGPFLGSKPLSSWLVLGAVRLVGRSAARGAEPQLFAATAPGVEGGSYFGPQSGVHGPPTLTRIWSKGRDADDAERLWDVSKQLTGVDIDAIITRASAVRGI